MSNRKHWLGLEYCKPPEAGLASEAKAVAQRLGKLLTGLEQINEYVIEPGKLTDKLRTFKLDLIQELKEDGWRIAWKDGSERYAVKAPNSEEHRNKLVRACFPDKVVLKSGRGKALSTPEGFRYDSRTNSFIKDE